MQTRGMLQDYNKLVSCVSCPQEGLGTQILPRVPELMHWPVCVGALWLCNGAGGSRP